VPSVLGVAGLEAFHGRAHILFGVSLSVGPGEVVALLGRNGAGKSTTLRAVMGLVRPHAGTVRFRGADIVGLPPYRIARMGLGYVPEDRRILTTLTVEENLEVGRQPPRPGAPAWTPERLFALFPRLADLRRRPAGRMSGGEQQMLTIARTLMGNPSCILLDEPSEGLAPLIVEHLARTLGELKREGLSVLVAEPNLRFAGDVGDRAYVIEKGRIRFEGAMATLRADEALRRQYLAV
jgi:branched-chain amino acid transport system ATP-binding protein